MKVTVDASVCIGAGMCALTAPAVFDQDEDDGTVVLLDGTPPPDCTPPSARPGGCAPRAPSRCWTPATRATGEVGRTVARPAVRPGRRPRGPAARRRPCGGPAA